MNIVNAFYDVHGDDPWNGAFGLSWQVFVGFVGFEVGGQYFVMWGNL